jgi:hypothetical protein
MSRIPNTAFSTVNKINIFFGIRYVYGWVSMDYWRMTLVKRDLEEPSQDKVWARMAHYPGELNFIPNPGKK